ncbi:phosphocholine cytidylyltransferase family protein [bacterium]|nr:phosphocholine cytidylyltransferase family protein [bacterium]MBU1650588.1 phosphocholine cytidylyltransferase family protein [bacterium]MBU1881885.1 phosphocholine cytidylyltransferase family protein [bacterium]
MQAIILAAGAGKRMGGSVPKPLLEIDGRPLIIRIIAQLRHHDISEIVVVTGARKNLIEDALIPYHIKTVFNPFYVSSDNLVSFWMGQEHISQTCIMAHADIIFEDNLLERLIAAEGDIVLPMDASSIDEEAMKILEVEGRLMDLSKTIPVEVASGESIPLMKFSYKALQQLKALTSNVLESGRFGLYIDDSVLELVQIGNFETTILDVTGAHWAEIDTQEDLARARSIFNQPR